MGDSKVDANNSILKEEQMLSLVIHSHIDKSTFCRLVKGSKGDVTITISMSLEKGAVLRAICAGFEEASCLFERWLEHIQDPLVGVGTFTEYGGTLWRCVCFEHKFMSEYFSMADVETNECLDNSGGCWQDK
ncbi:hypothetical protein Patl1_10320 [Pistacia atlantica]|uniref:Uncharacterized protein n=1 Tax=Pistacia atlantica TaxID=434234 RepID=A0ACC1AAH7_9ROSI|nr:hypothetical protein Patl1_10320 [Pistacia atlantica]